MRGVRETIRAAIVRKLEALRGFDPVCPSCEACASELEAAYTRERAARDEAGALRARLSTLEDSMWTGAPDPAFVELHAAYDLARARIVELERERAEDAETLCTYLLQRDAAKEQAHALLCGLEDRKAEIERMKAELAEKKGAA